MTETLARPKAPWALRLLPPFPAVAQRILALVGQQNITARQVGDLIKLDPSFSAELLRLANSALFGARREVTSLGQAVMMLGMDQVKSMATFVAVNNMVRSSLRIQGLRKVWMHSLVTALVAHEASRAARIDACRFCRCGSDEVVADAGIPGAVQDRRVEVLDGQVGAGIGGQRVAHVQGRRGRRQARNAELSAGIVTPGEHPAIGGNGDGIAGAGRNRHHVVRKFIALGYCLHVAARPRTRYAVAAVAPCQDGAIRLQDQRMVVPGSRCQCAAQRHRPTPVVHG